MPRDQWPAGLAEDVQDTWDAQRGDRRTELVCIGRALDPEAARSQLEGCLLTTEEMAAGEKSWLALSDPWPDPFANPFAKDGTLREGAHDQG